MLTRILRKLNFYRLRSGILGFERFSKDILPDKHFLKAIEQNKKKLQPYYDQYTREISRADMAASLELATFMFTLCKENHYTKLLDMGSGLSSFVFRLYAKETPGVVVYSVDDDSVWLEKTKDFLRKHQLSTERIEILEKFLISEETNFDCILHDLNFVEVRINYIEWILKIMKRNGLVIFDDVHKPDYLFALLNKLKNNDVKMYDVKAITVDHYERFSLAVVKN